MPTEEQRPLFSVVIPTYQRNDLLERCLRCLAPGAQLGMVLSAKAASNSRCPVVAGDAQFQISETHLSTSPTYEVIVADDGRASTAEAMIREQFPWAQWVQGPGTGPAGNRNAGARLAQGEWLAFTDDDCLPQAGWLNAFHKEIDTTSRPSVLEGKTMPDRPRLTLSEHAPVGSQGGNLWSCNFAILKSVFESLSGFDARFRVCMEDSDFALRVKLAGYHFPFVENALVIHPWRPRRLTSDGWKSNGTEFDDHLRFKGKHPSAEAMMPMRLFRLGIRVFWCDVCFIYQRNDIRGLAFASNDLLKLIKISIILFRQKVEV